MTLFDTIFASLVLAPDRRSDCKLCKIASARSAIVEVFNCNWYTDYSMDEFCG